MKLLGSSPNGYSRMFRGNSQKTYRSSGGGGGFILGHWEEAPGDGIREFRQKDEGGTENEALRVGKSVSLEEICV